MISNEDLEKIQTINDNLYKKYNDDEDIIELQVLINRFRNELDVVDPKEVVTTSDGKEFVQ
ncbi:hypothetical protein [Methanosphaera sp.]